MTPEPMPEQAPAPTPETHAEKVSHVTQLISEQPETDTPEDPKANGEDRGQQAAHDDAGGDGSTTSQLDGAEPDAIEDVEETAEGVAGEDTGAVSVKGLAEHLGIEPADVYELEIPVGAEGETVTLGEMKDNFKEYGPVKEAQQAVKQERDNYEKQILQTRTELNQIMQLIPAEMRQQLLSQARDRNSNWQNEQEKLVLEAVPDWADADTRAKDRGAIVDLGSDYGFSESEMTYTQDARTLRLLRDMASMRREMQDMRAAAKREPGKPNAPGKRAPTQSKSRKLAAALSKAKSSPTMQNKEAAVSALIRAQ